MIVIFEYYAPWCTPCKNLSPILKELEQEFPGLIVEKINVELDREKYKEIKSVPYVVIEKDGIQVDSFVGFKTKRKFTELINKYV